MFVTDNRSVAEADSLTVFGSSRVCLLAQTQRSQSPDREDRGRDCWTNVHAGVQTEVLSRGGSGGPEASITV